MVSEMAASARPGRVVAEPSNSVKAPRTLVTMAWRATKPISVWLGSIVYCPDRAERATVAAGALVMETPDIC